MKRPSEHGAAAAAAPGKKKKKRTKINTGCSGSFWALVKIIRSMLCCCSADREHWSWKMRGKPTKPGKTQWEDPTALRVHGFYLWQVLRGSHYTGLELPVGLEPAHNHHELNTMTKKTQDLFGAIDRHRNSGRLVQQMLHEVWTHGF